MSITLSRESILDNSDQTRHTWPLRITATSNLQGLTSKIFVYHSGVTGDPYGEDIFSCVASVHNLFEYPEDEATGSGDNYIPFYRTNVLTFHCHSPQEADDLWEKIQYDVADLVTGWNSLSALEASETVTIVGYPGYAEA